MQVAYQTIEGSPYSARHATGNHKTRLSSALQVIVCCLFLLTVLGVVGYDALLYHGVGDAGEFTWQGLDIRLPGTSSPPADHLAAEAARASPVIEN